MNVETPFSRGRASALLVIDMQVGSFSGPSVKHDVGGVVERINSVASAVRAANGIVVFIQHDGEDAYRKGSNEWQIVPALARAEGDVFVEKRACDAFYETNLAPLLEAIARPGRIMRRNDRPVPLLLPWCVTLSKSERNSCCGNRPSRVVS